MIRYESKKRDIKNKGSIFKEYKRKCHILIIKIKKGKSKNAFKKVGIARI